MHSTSKTADLYDARSTLTGQLGVVLRNSPRVEICGLLTKLLINKKNVWIISDTINTRTVLKLLHRFIQLLKNLLYINAEIDCNLVLLKDWWRTWLLNLSVFRHGPNWTIRGIMMNINKIPQSCFGLILLSNLLKCLLNLYYTPRLNREYTRGRLLKLH